MSDTPLDDYIRSDLRQYATDAKYDDEVRAVQRAVEHIKQAFKEAGWLPRVEREVQIPPIVWPPGVNSKLMTGPEWYERFEKELKGKIFPHHCANDAVNVANVLEECKAAARRATAQPGAEG